MQLELRVVMRRDHAQEGSWCFDEEAPAFAGAFCAVIESRDTADGIDEADPAFVAAAARAEVFGETLPGGAADGAGDTLMAVTGAASGAAARRRCAPLAPPVGVIG